MSEQHVKAFLSIVDPNRPLKWMIEGKHPLLPLWKAWYSGDTSWHYTHVIRDGQKRLKKRKSSGVAKLFVEEWASNYANEDTKITVVCSDATDKAVQKILKDQKVFSKFGGFVEKFMALGIGATVVMPSKFLVSKDGTVTKSNNSKVKISFLDAERIIPITVDDGVCTECAFVKYSTTTCTLQMHILVNGKYEIHEVVGTNIGTGKGYNFDYSKRKVLKLNTDQPLFQIWHPNIVDNKDFSNQLGTSIYADALDWFKSIDITLDSFYTEFKNGAKKRFVSTQLMYIDEEGNQRRPLLDDEELYVPLGDDGKTLLTEFNAELRVDSHINALNFLLNMAAAKCGMGDSKFKFNGTGEPMETATGVRAKQTTFYRNIIKQENFAADRFRNMLMAVAYVNNNFTTNPTLTYEEENIEVVFDDNIVEDTTTKKAAELQEVQAGVMTIAEFRSHWYDEDYDAAIKFVQENMMLLAPYSMILQAGLITPEMFVEYVFGAKVKNREELIQYITESLGRTDQGDEDYNDESDIDEDNPDDDAEDDDE